MPKVSVIIPVYNVEKYLRKCVDSVLNQTLDDLEIILVDDGSTDKSGQICDFYANSPKVKVIHQSNKGLSAARNAGMRLAEGDYIAFLDSDDYVAPEMYNEMYSRAENKQVDIVYCNYAIVKNDKIISGGSTYLPPNRKIERAEIRNIMISEQSNTVLWFAVKSLFSRRLLIENGIWFLEENIIEDTPFNLDAILSANAVWFIDKTFYYYVQTPNSLMRDKYKKNFCEKLDNCYQARKSISDKHELQDYYKNLYRYNMKHSLVMLITNEIGNPASLLERVEQLRKIRGCELARETFKNEKISCIPSRIKWPMLFLKWKLYFPLAIILR